MSTEEIRELKAQVESLLTWKNERTQALKVDVESLLTWRRERQQEKQKKREALKLKAEACKILREKEHQAHLERVKERNEKTAKWKAEREEWNEQDKERDRKWKDQDKERDRKWKEEDERHDVIVYQSGYPEVVPASEEVATSPRFTKRSMIYHPTPNETKVILY
jgi:hypothetical protein